MMQFGKYKVLWEILILWLIWLLIIFSLTDGFSDPVRFTKRIIPTFIGFFIIVYINVQYLIPKLYVKKKHILFALGGAILLAATVLLIYHDVFPWSDWFLIPPPLIIREMGLDTEMAPQVKWVRELTPLIIAFLGSTLFEITRLSNIKEKEKLSAELKFLKSQVNPHFLFNALNNIYSLSVVQSDQTSESIMQLSEILRYMVYDSNEEKVPLEKEITYIENFIELQLLKDSRGMDIEVDLDKSAGGLMIAPLMFIPFVENAFKHSKIENLKDGFIKIHLKVKGKELEFGVVNSVSENNFTKDKVGGVGLENTRKRLRLVYPDDQHQLEIHQTDKQFKVKLKIKIR